VPACSQAASASRGIIKNKYLAPKIISESI
jgi:hypothetical protein